MTVELLAYANRQKVAEALTERGYSVTRMTVNRWARGNEMPAIAVRLILEIFGHNPDTTNEPPPWARALEERLRLELRLNRALIEGDDSEETLGELERMRAELHGQAPGELPPDAIRPMASPRHPGSTRGSGR